MKIADVLDEAAGIVGRGWVQGKSYVFDGHGNLESACLFGALCRAADDMDGSEYDALNFVDSLCPSSNAITWNDEPGRTQAEVVAKLREAAAEAREQGL